MNERDKKLARRLLYLPIDLTEKVLMWLTYRNLKPVSEITVVRRRKKFSKEQLNAGRERIMRWLQDAGMVHSEWEGGGWHIGKDVDKVRLSARILRNFDYQSEVKTGELFGFPKDSVEAYASSRNMRVGEEPERIIWPGLQTMHPLTKGKDFLPYLFFAVKTDSAKEDMEVAKRWAEAIRSEVPKLAKWYETEYKKDIKADEIKLKSLRLAVKRNNQSTDEILDEYSTRNKDIVGILKRAVEELRLNIISEYQFSTICYKLLKKFKVEKNKDNDLLETLNLGLNSHLVSSGSNAISEQIRKARKIDDWYKKNKG